MTNEPQTPESPFDRNVRLAVLIVTNLVPLAGVVFWGWSTGEIILLYWVENIVVGLVNIPKIMACQGNITGKAFEPPPNGEPTTSLGRSARDAINTGEANEPAVDPSMAAWAGFMNIPLAAFFTVHYGIFTLVHGVFVATLFLGGNFNFDFFFGLSIAGLAAHHIFDFFWKFIGNGDFRKRGPDTQMFSPYGRIVVLHISILFGGFLIMGLGNPIFALVLFVLLKIGFEVGLLFTDFDSLGKAERLDA